MYQLSMLKDMPILDKISCESCLVVKDILSALVKCKTVLDALFISYSFQCDMLGFVYNFSFKIVTIYIIADGISLALYWLCNGVMGCTMFVFLRVVSKQTYQETGEPTNCWVRYAGQFWSVGRAINMC